MSGWLTPEQVADAIRRALDVPLDGRGGNPNPGRQDAGGGQAFNPPVIIDGRPDKCPTCGCRFGTEAP